MRSTVHPPGRRPDPTVVGLWPGRCPAPAQ